MTVKSLSVRPSEGLLVSNWYTPQMHVAAQVCCKQNLFGSCKHSITSEWQLHHACVGKIDATDTPKSEVARLTKGNK